VSRRIGLRTMGSIGATGLCTIKIVVQADTTPNATHMVELDGVDYHNGEKATLEKGDYTLTWASGDGGVFSSWGTSGKLSVADPSAESTTLTVTCGGTLTLNMVACPSGEQIVNGGFETGDLTGWTEETAGALVDSSTSKTGTYSLKLVAGSSCAIVQYFTPINQACISSFTLYYKMPLGAPAWGTGAQIIYEDDSTTDLAFYGGTANFLACNLKLVLEPAKGKVKGIRLKSPGVVDAWVDDVSLVGAG